MNTESYIAFRREKKFAPGSVAINTQDLTVTYISPKGVFAENNFSTPSTPSVSDSSAPKP
jgi:hypothetical protein